jgi:hypothetical protein
MRSKNPAEFFFSPHPASLDSSISKNPDEFFAASPYTGVRGDPHDLREFQHCKKVLAAGGTCDSRYRLQRTQLSTDLPPQLFFSRMDRFVFPVSQVLPGSVAQGGRSNIERGIHVGMGHVPAVRALEMFSGPSSETAATAAPF